MDRSKISKHEIIRFSPNPDESFNELPERGHEARLVKWYGNHLAKKLGEQAMRLGSYNSWFTKPSIPKSITHLPEYICSPEKPSLN